MILCRADLAQCAPPPLADLQQKNQEVLELLQERVTLFCELAEVTSGQEDLQPPITRCLFRGDVPHAPRAGKLLLDATAEGNSVCVCVCVRILNILLISLKFINV